MGIVLYEKSGWIGLIILYINKYLNMDKEIFKKS